MITHRLIALVAASLFALTTVGCVGNTDEPTDDGSDTSEPAPDPKDAPKKTEEAPPPVQAPPLEMKVKHDGPCNCYY